MHGTECRYEEQRAGETVCHAPTAPHMLPKEPSDAAYGRANLRVRAGQTGPATKRWLMPWPTVGYVGVSPVSTMRRPE